MADLVRVFSTTDPVDARIAAAALTGLGLHPVVLGEGLAEFSKASRYAIPIRLLIPEPELTQAREAIADMRTPKALTDETGRDACPACDAVWQPGFEVCWSCYAEAPKGVQPKAQATDELEIKSDAVSVVLRGMPRRMDVAAVVSFLAGVACIMAPPTTRPETLDSPIHPIDALPGLLLLFLLMVTAMRAFQLVRIQLDRHALTINDDVYLLEDIQELWVGSHVLEVTMERGASYSLPVLVPPRHRKALMAAIEVLRGQVREPRDEASLQAVRNLRPG